MDRTKVSFKSRWSLPLIIKRVSGVSGTIVVVVLTVLMILNPAGITKAEWVDTIADVGIAVQYDDNINRSFFTFAEKDDASLVPSASVGRVYQLADFTRVRATADVKGEIHEEFDKLNSFFGGATLAVSHKLGVGPNKPWLRIHGAPGYLLVNDDLRDSWLLDTGVRIGKRFHERIDLAVGYVYDFRDADPGDVVPGTNLSSSVFDQDGHTLSLLSNFLVANNFLFSLEYSFRHGDIAATCNAEIVNSVINDIDAITFDPAFHEGFDERPICAYKVRGDIHNFAVGSTYAIGNHSSVNVMYNRTEGDASGLDYSDNSVNVSFNYSFQ